MTRSEVGFAPTQQDRKDLRILAGRLWAGYKHVTGAHASARHSRQGRFLHRGPLLLDLSSERYCSVFVLHPSDAEVRSQGDDPQVMNGSTFPIVDGEAINVTKEDGPWWPAVREAIRMATAELDDADRKAKELSVLNQLSHRAEQDRKMNAAREAFTS